MRRVRGVRAAGAGLLLLLLGGAGEAQRYGVEIQKEVFQRIPLAIGGFAPLPDKNPGADLATVARSVAAADLDFTGLFEVIDPTFLPVEVRKLKPGDQAEVLPMLALFKVQGLLLGTLEQRATELALEAQVYDVERGTAIVARRYLGEATAVRQIAHRLADEIVFRYTGERGVAQTRIAYVGARDGARELYVMDYDGHNPILLTGNRSINLSPRWSPDGRLLAYTSYRDGNPDLFLLNLQTGARTKLSAVPGLNISPAWSPDGEWVALSLSKDGGTNIYLMRKDGSGLRALTSGSGISVSPTFSPNGRQIAFTSDRGGSPQIYAIDLEGTNLRRLTFQGDYNSSPRWSPRGDKIAFTSNLSGRFQITLMNQDGSGVQTLTSEGGNEDPAWSRDGRHLAFTSTRTGQREIFVMRADGSAPRQLTRTGGNFAPDWSQ
ncbi:MAG TPA: Tol-Pal system beta propeller repeat protein TolB [Candidatus Methylomirabilis sp.]|jgi:TolB protein|nr:Tol-Pal system beta propeller repeat protein TolB [Candidatus Methylomirabilis sp.]